jgi:hypothetical protein
MNVSALEIDPDNQKDYLSDTIVEIIRLCWQTEPSERPNMAKVCEMLNNELFNEVS